AANQGCRSGEPVKRPLALPPVPSGAMTLPPPATTAAGIQNAQTAPLDERGDAGDAASPDTTNAASASDDDAEPHDQAQQCLPPTRIADMRRALEEMYGDAPPRLPGPRPSKHHAARLALRDPCESRPPQNFGVRTFDLDDDGTPDWFIDRGGVGTYTSTCVYL